MKRRRKPVGKGRPEGVEEALGKGRMVAVLVGRAEELVTKPDEEAMLE